MVKEKKRIKIHFKGFNKGTDEWHDYREDLFPFLTLEKAYIPQEISLENRKNSLYGQFYREVNHKLWFGDCDDPDIRIELNKGLYWWLKHVIRDREKYIRSLMIATWMIC